jgi:Zn-dependent M16 (insulinase) family peptidase
LLEEYPVDTVEEAIVGVIKGLDRPLQPAAQALEADRLARKGVTWEMRKEFRSRVLLTTQQDVTRAATLWLKGVAPSRSAAVGKDVVDLAGLESVDLAA